MATQLMYSEAERSRLKTFEWAGRGNTNRAMRAIKMLRPICKDCQGNADTNVPGWHEKCKHFDDPLRKYWQLSAKTIGVTVYKEDEDGDLVIDEEATKSGTKTKYVLIPNWVEIPLRTGNYDGKGPQLMARKGFKLPQQVGLAPMCQFYGCGKAWPKFRCENGDYCSIGQAKLAMADEDEIILVTTGFTQGGRAVARERKRQIDDIVV